MSWLNDNFISRFFVVVIGWFYSLTGNYLIAVLLFTLTIKLLLLPFDIMQRKAQLKQAAVAPKVKEIQNRYKSDPRMSGVKVQELYKKEGIKTSAGCVPMLLQLPVLFAMFGAITLLSNIQTINLVTNLANGSVVMPPSAVWVHNIWRPDAGNSTVMPNMNEYDALVKAMSNRMDPERIAQSNTLLANTKIYHLALTDAAMTDVAYPAGTYFGNLVHSAYVTVPQSSVTAAVSLNYNSAIAPVVNAYAGMANGYYIIPILAAASTYFSQWLQKKQNEKSGTAAAQQTAGMEYIMPVITLWWTATSGVPFAMYWMATNLLSIASIPLLNSVLSKNETGLQTTD